MLTLISKAFAGAHVLTLRFVSCKKYILPCRALVAEALEISFFMTRLQDESQSEELEEEDMKQWASAWSQIMHQLRHGIKLRY